MARTKNHSGFLRRGYRPDSSPDSEERGRPNKRVFVADDGQGGSDQVEDDAENDTEEEVETRHVSPEKRVTRNGGKKKTVAPAVGEDSENDGQGGSGQVEDDTENDSEEEVETRHVSPEKRVTRNGGKKKTVAPAVEEDSENDGQGGSDQGEDDIENDTEEEVETRHVSPEKRVTRNGGKKKTVAPAVEEDSENDTEEEEETEHVVTVKRGTRKPVKNKPDARAPKTSIKSHTMPVRDGLVLEKRKPKHTRNYKVTNYKAMSRANYVAVRTGVDHFQGTKTASDPRFWSRVQQDIYESILLEQNTPLVAQEHVNLGFMEQHRARFPACVELIDAMGLRGILTLHCDWSEQAIMQFFATCQFCGDERRTLVWMTEGVKLSVSFEEFAQLLKIPIEDNLERIHDTSLVCESKNAAALDPLRRPGLVLEGDNTLHGTSTLEPLYAFMHKVITKSLVPKSGDRGNVRNFAIDLLVRMHTHGQERFDLADFIFQQIRLASFEQKRSFPYAPFIQVLIDAKFQRGKIYKDCKHKMWTPKVGCDGQDIPVQRTHKRIQAPLDRPSKFERLMAKTQRVLFRICSSNAEEIANMNSVHRVKLNSYKDKVRQLGGVASDNEDIASSSTARPKIRFRTKGYEEFFENASSDEDGGSASEDATE